MKTTKKSSLISTIAATAFAAFALHCSPASADDGAVGVWIDHTGRGAVEIAACNGRLCGRIVWLKDAHNGQGCGMQVIGNLPQTAPGVWDGGWIFDPDEDTKYDVEIRLVGGDRLKVTGYEGMKMLGQTMMWHRAPADLQRCKA